MKREVPTGRVDRDSQLGNKKFVAQYEEVARALDRKHRGVSAEYAASLACDIQQFMEDHLGAHVEAPVMTKLDAKVRARFGAALQASGEAHCCCPSACPASCFSMMHSESMHAYGGLELE